MITPRKRCIHCGRDKTDAGNMGSYFCNPPFKVQSHVFAVDHPYLVEVPPKVGDGTPDAALAISEHAFRAGYEAARVTCANYMGRDMPDDVEGAWSLYDPPEDIKALS